MERQNKHVQYKYKIGHVIILLHTTMFLLDHFSREKIDGGKKWNLLFVSFLVYHWLVVSAFIVLRRPSLPPK